MSVLNIVVALKLHVNIIIVHIHQESLFQSSKSKVDFLSRALTLTLQLIIFFFPYSILASGHYSLSGSIHNFILEVLFLFKLIAEAYNLMHPKH